ncbi:MAG TPA: transglycosylase SLT domain-containing protein [Bacteroidota bacterium]|nr:transglycosylase SLT domain-containing protein [Bacteroidota bacterium]
MKNHIFHILRACTSLLVIGGLAMVCLQAPLRSEFRPAGDQTAVLRQAPADKTSFSETGVAQYPVVKRFAQEYHIDWRLIMAMMRQESQFQSDAVSSRGARGLMQIMPVTNSELSDELNITTPDLPEQNVRAGVYYFSKLVDLFRDAAPDDRFCLALAAYNAGPGRIYDAQELAAYFNENPHSWTTIQHLLPLLSKRYYSLHQHVWKSGKPTNGYFKSSRQTTEYVAQIMNAYNSSKSALF